MSIARRFASGTSPNATGVRALAGANIPDLMRGVVSFRWVVVLVSLAMVGGAFTVGCNRPRDEPEDGGVSVGGPGTGGRVERRDGPARMGEGGAAGADDAGGPGGGGGTGGAGGSGGGDSDASIAQPSPPVPCGPGQHACSGACVDNTALANCGQSCERCPDVPGGTPTCDGTSCGASCPGGTFLCAGACIPDGRSCNMRCAMGKHDCNGTCALDTDVNLCGAACLACKPPENGDARCEGGACAYTCRQNFYKCGDLCVALDKPCGASCPPERSRLCDGRCVPGGDGSCCSSDDCPACNTCQNNRCQAGPNGQQPRCMGSCRECRSGSCEDKDSSTVCQSRACRDGRITEGRCSGGECSQNMVVDDCDGNGCSSSGCNECSGSDRQSCPSRSQERVCVNGKFSNRSCGDCNSCQGNACGRDDNAGGCDSGKRCEGGRCVDLLRFGARCENSAQCRQGAECYETLDEGKICCQDGCGSFPGKQTCDRDTGNCGKRDGAECGFSAECASSFCTANGLCQDANNNTISCTFSNQGDCVTPCSLQGVTQHCE
jgi:hypothetical protein